LAADDTLPSKGRCWKNEKRINALCEQSLVMGRSIHAFLKVVTWHALVHTWVAEGSEGQ